MQNVNGYACKRFLIFFIAIACSMASNVKAQIIPAPLHKVVNTGSFQINTSTRWFTNLQGDDKKWMQEYLKTLPVALSEGTVSDKTNVITLVVSPLKGTTNKEAYHLQITPQDIEITANTAAGLFYGIQTALQLSSQSTQTSMTIPCAEISDQPRFGYRGFMLDVSRHFFPKEFIFKMLDMLAYYKINVFHFHLVDTGGWRIEIDKYPNLTNMTAYRPAEDLDDWWSLHNVFCAKSDSNAYGGYYTKIDIREIVHYATVRHIEVIPEIDMPGHSRDVLCAYPGLACDGKDYMTSNELCIGKEETFDFCENVLKEVMELFPSKYIHIGGDEANRTIWSTCPKCQKRMRKENIHNVADLQNYFTNRIEKFLNAHGKTMIGWDEILDGKVSKRAVVMSWREEVDGTGEALRRGHHIILTPTSHCYLDYYQDIPYTQPKAFGYIPLSKIYSFEPIPQHIADSSLIVGVQGNLWTEHVPTCSHAEYMSFPRMLAIAEVGWSAPQAKSYTDFHERALHAIEYMESKGFHPFPLKYEIGPRPEAMTPVHHLAYGKKVTYLKPHHEADYKGSGNTTLTDGMLGDWGPFGSRWQGFYGDMDVVVDLGFVQKIHSVSASFLQVLAAGLLAPNKIEILVSDNGRDFTSLYKENCRLNDHINYDIIKHKWEGSIKTRFIRLHATRDITWGNILSDEIVVK